jgi:hypothetical protein
MAQDATNLEMANLIPGNRIRRRRRRWPWCGFVGLLAIPDGELVRWWRLGHALVYTARRLVSARHSKRHAHTAVKNSRAAGSVLKWVDNPWLLFGTAAFRFDRARMAPALARSASSGRPRRR